MKDIDINLLGLINEVLKYMNKFSFIHFIQLLCTKTVAERNCSKSRKVDGVSNILIKAHLKQKNQIALDSL